MQSDQLSIIQTADGSASLYNSELGETYHSRHGAVQESLHVFIQSGLNFRCTQAQEELTIFEIGFGTGLNAALTLLQSEILGQKVNYTSIEKFDLGDKGCKDFIAASPEHLQFSLGQVIQARWQHAIVLTSHFTLLKLLDDATTALFPPCDVLFLDAFAPAVSPELWTTEMMRKYFECLQPNGILVTYCAKGVVRRAMQEVGFITERIPGPPGKREMLRAIKPKEL